MGHEHFRLKDLGGIKNDLANWAGSKWPESEDGGFSETMDGVAEKYGLTTDSQKEEAYMVLFGENTRGETPEDLKRKRAKEIKEWDDEYKKMDENNRRILKEPGFAEELARQQAGPNAPEELVAMRAETLMRQAMEARDAAIRGQEEMEKFDRIFRENSEKEAEKKRREKEFVAEQERLQAEEAAERNRKDKRWLGLGRFFK